MRRLLFGGSLLLGLLSLASPQAAHAAPATVLVNVVADAAAGGCSTSGTGLCTLRDAVIFANHHPGSTITVPAGTYTLTNTGKPESEAQTGDLDLRQDMTINGAGPGQTIIDGYGLVSTLSADRVFDIFPTTGGISVLINGLTVQHGTATDTYGGGGIWSGWGARVTLTNSVVKGNSTSWAHGGGIVSDGSVGPVTSLTLINSVVNGNVVIPATASQVGNGGGIYATNSVVDIENSTISQNNLYAGRAGAAGSGITAGAAQGGGVMAEAAASLTIIGSRISFNEAIGGLGTVTAGVEGSGGNSYGGGVAKLGAGPLQIINSTLDGNQATGGDGEGGPQNGSGSGFGGGLSTYGPTTLINDTLNGNTAETGSTSAVSAGQGRGGGLYLGTTYVGQITNTLIAQNTITSGHAANGADLNGNLSSGGHNLIGIGDGSGPFAPSDLVGSALVPLDAKLAATTVDNGGPTMTRALLAGSPAINAGDGPVCARPLPPAGAPNGAGNVDQRGVARPQPVGGQCDIGAYEYVYAPTTTTLTSSANPAAVGQAITFTATVSGSNGPMGTVVIKDGATSLGGGTLAGGVVTVTTAALAAGTHAITASYAGDTISGPSSAGLTQTVGSAGGLQFFPLAQPVRLLDTRPGQPAVVHPDAALIGNQPVNLPGHFTSGSITIPANAQALVGNATVDNTIGVPAGFATLWPSGTTLPLASNLNFVPGTTRPNAFTVGLGGDGSFNLLSNTGGNFIIDITGYYAPPASGGLYFHPLAQPVRLLDTRVGANAVVHPDAALTAGQTLNLAGQFTSNGMSVPASAKALAGNATVDNTVNAPAGFATLFPGGTGLPPTSNLNYAPGTIAPNAFTVALGSDGSFNLFSQSGGDFLIDITGYYDTVPSAGLLFHALAQPVRELDTRAGASAATHPNAPLAAAGTLSLPGAFDFGGVSVPATATALVGNATVDNSSGVSAGFATLYPGGGALPLASNLNYSPGLVAPNAFIVGVGTDATYNMYSQSSTNYIIDISGYFAAS